MNKDSEEARFSITVPYDQFCRQNLLDKSEAMWLGTKSWVRSKPCSECGSTRFIESESLERRIDRMADEAKAEVCAMADAALAKLMAYTGKGCGVNYPYRLSVRSSNGQANH